MLLSDLSFIVIVYFSAGTLLRDLRSNTLVGFVVVMLADLLSLSLLSDSLCPKPG